MYKNLIDFTYINQKDKNLVELFVNSTKQKYILGINKYTKSILKNINVDGIIDDFTRVQSSRKKDILQIKDIPQNSIILWTSFGSPLEVKNKLDEMGFENISYLSFYKYSNLNLIQPPFMADFKEDFKNNHSQYQKTYNLLNDQLSKDIFIKILNFKISFDYNFMNGFTNDFDKQYFESNLIPDIKNITFLDGGGYVGDTVPNIIKNFPDFTKIYLIEPNHLHINIAKRDCKNIKNIEFINCGLSNKIRNHNEKTITNNETTAQPKRPILS